MHHHLALVEPAIRHFGGWHFGRPFGGYFFGPVWYDYRPCAFVHYYGGRDSGIGILLVGLFFVAIIWAVTTVRNRKE